MSLNVIGGFVFYIWTVFIDDACTIAHKLIKILKSVWLFVINKIIFTRFSTRVWGQGNIHGKSGSAVNQGFVWFTLCMFSPIWGKENGRCILGFAVNQGAVNRGFTVPVYIICKIFSKSSKMQQGVYLIWGNPCQVYRLNRIWDSKSVVNACLML